MKTTVYIILLFLFACTNGTQKSEFTYVVSPFNKAKDPNGPPPIPIPFYAPLNFLIDSAGNFFFYQRNIGILTCLSGYDYETPNYIGLQPQDLVLVPSGKFYEFIKANVYSVEKDYRVVGISSLKDTIKSNSLRVIIDSFTVANNRTRFYIRKATQEEVIVLDHKLQQIPYNPKNVTWDFTKVKFLPTAETKFLPPNSDEK